jgi:hypothetical protein
MNMFAFVRLASSRKAHDYSREVTKQLPICTAYRYARTQDTGS